MWDLDVNVGTVCAALHFLPVARYAKSAVCSVIQCLNQLPQATEVKLLRTSKDMTGEEQEEKGKDEGGGG